MTDLVLTEAPALAAHAPSFAPHEVAPADLARLVAAFRAELSEYGVETPRVFRSSGGTSLTCTRCLFEGAEGLGYRVERLAARRRDAFEAYENLTWRIDGKRQDDLGRIKLYAPTHYGLVRLSRGDEELWLWSCEVNLATHQWHEVLVASPEREAVRELLQASYERHEGRERKRQLLLFDGYQERWVDAGEHDWSEVFLPEGMREELLETIEGFFASRELYREHGIPHRRGILLSGEPGNGKTSLIKVMGAQLDLPVVVARLSNEASDHTIREAFERAQDLAPVVLCFEDLDALLDDDGHRLSTFLNLMDGVVPLDGVLVVATTNRPDRIDPAIAKRPSRFDRVFLIPQPAEPQRAAFLAHLLRDAPADWAAEVAAETEGFSMAFLKELVLQARLRAVGRGERALTREDLEVALANTQEHLRLASRGLEDRGNVGF